MQHPPFPRRGAGWLRPAAAGGGQEGPFSPRVPCSDIPALPGTGLGRGGCTARARHAAASVKLGNRGKRRKGGGHALTRPRPCRGKEVAAPHGGEARPAPALPPRSPGERGSARPLSREHPWRGSAGAGAFPAVACCKVKGENLSPRFYF